MSSDPLLTWKGRRVRSPGDGRDAAVRKVPEAPRPGSLFFIPSPLEGWGLPELLQRLPEQAVVVLFERDQELAAHCLAAFHEELGPWNNHPRLFWLESDTEAAVQDLFRRLPLAVLRRCELLTLNGAWLAHGARYREILARIDQGLTRWWSNRITCMHMGPLWIRNLFDNLARLNGEPERWPDWGDDPVVVCGAGLSLEAALPWLKQRPPRWRVVAADTALPVLKDYGVIPDAVVCLEAQHANLRDFAGWKGASPLLFTDLTSFPPGTRVFASKPRWFLTEFTELQLWDRFPWPKDRVPRLPPLGSVGVAAAWVAWRLSQGPVVLAGLDFSYPAGRTHARGAPSLSGLAARTDRLHPMEQPRSWAGGGTHRAPSGWLTTTVMEGYAGVLADQARTHQKRTRVWSRQGLDLGLEVWPGREVVPPSPARGPFHGEVLPPSMPAEDWLALEGSRWDAILGLFVDLNRNPADPTIRRRLESGLRGVDYLTFPFPDPELRMDTDWLARAQAQIRWIQGRVSRPRSS